MAENPQTITGEEANALCVWLLKRFDGRPPDHKSYRNHLIARLMVEAGLRVGEVTKLIWSDLYFNDEPVQSIVVRSEITKTKTERSIPCSLSLLTGMKFYKGNFPDHFLTTNLWPTVRQIQRVIKTAGIATMNRLVTPHTLRHTFATRLMRITNIRTVQELLGHKRLTSTQIYTHPSIEDKQDAISKM